MARGVEEGLVEAWTAFYGRSLRDRREMGQRQSCEPRLRYMSTRIKMVIQESGGKLPKHDVAGLVLTGGAGVRSA